jgi:hypothetical protein
MKPIRYSNHARLQMVLRGVTEEEVTMAIRSGEWKTAKMGKSRSKYRFDFNRISLTNQKFYKYKIVEPVFTEELNELVVITVKVYYFDYVKSSMKSRGDT